MSGPRADETSCSTYGPASSTAEFKRPVLRRLCAPTAEKHQRWTPVIAEQGDVDARQKVACRSINCLAANGICSRCAQPNINACCLRSSEDLKWRSAEGVTGVGIEGDQARSGGRRGRFKAGTRAAIRDAQMVAARRYFGNPVFAAVICCGISTWIQLSRRACECGSHQSDRCALNGIAVGVDDASGYNALRRKYDGQTVDHISRR